MKFKKVAHLYFGSIQARCGKLSGWPLSQKTHPLDARFWVENADRGLTPLLRPLSDMTEEEKEYMDSLHPMPPELANTLHWIDMEPKIIEAHAQQVNYLLSRGFDLFGLIESGEAISQQTRSNNPQQ